jgi:hypothetical protein
MMMVLILPVLTQACALKIAMLILLLNNAKSANLPILIAWFAINLNARNVYKIII